MFLTKSDKTAYLSKFFYKLCGDNGYSENVPYTRWLTLASILQSPYFQRFAR